MLDDARGDLPDPRHPGRERVQTAGQVGGQKLAFFLAHLHELAERAFERLFD